MVESLPTFVYAIAAIEFLIIIGVGVWGVRSGVLRSQRDEWRELAEARGERVADLEVQISELRREVANLQGHIEAWERLKSDEIAFKVVSTLIDNDNK